MSVVYNNINEALNSVLSLEQAFLAADLYRRQKPLVFRPSFQKRIGSPFDCYFNDADDDKFIMTPLQTGRYSLKPNLRNRKFLYRGQSGFFDPCVPNMYRGKDYYLDDMIYDQELYILLLSHPFNQFLDIGFDVEGMHFSFEVNLFGIAQHYYNRTSLLDFTSDSNSAKFFAVTNYDKETDTYLPVLEEGTIGVLYYYDLNIHSDFLRDPVTNAQRLSTIGMQAFPRSEKQKGFLLNLAKWENLNDVRVFPQVHAAKFYHHPSITMPIYEEALKGEKYFPQDVLQSHWKQYNKDKKMVSLKAVHWNQHWNPEETISSITRKLDSYYGIQVRNYQPSFTSDELSDYYQDIKNGYWESFVDKIYIPGDKDGHLKESFLHISKQDEYRWAFEPDTDYRIDYGKGFLLKKYEKFLH